MRKRNLFFSIWIILLLIGCSPKSESDIFYKAQKKINKIESYSCQVEITSMGNKGPEKYVMKQWFKNPNKYKLEVMYPEELKGKTTIFDGNKGWIYHPAIEQVWVMEDFINSQEQSMFVGYFINNCLNSENTQISKKKNNGEEYLVIDTDIPGNHVYFSKEQLWINVENMKPFMLQVFDGKNQVRIEVKYKDFQYNPKIDEDTFKLTDINIKQ